MKGTPVARGGVLAGALALSLASCGPALAPGREAPGIDAHAIDLVLGGSKY